MAGYIVGRLYAWPEFTEDGSDTWVIHVGDPAFCMRVIHRPEDLMPTGDIPDLYFPLQSDARYALGNMLFLDPNPMEMADVAKLVAGAIDAIEDAAVLASLDTGGPLFDPVPRMVHEEDQHAGFVIGTYYDSDAGSIAGDAEIVAHIGLPPFVLRRCDLNEEDIPNDDIWASIEGEQVLGDLRWLSHIACAPEELRYLAETAAEAFRDHLEARSY